MIKSALQIKKATKSLYLVAFVFILSVVSIQVIFAQEPEVEGEDIEQIQDVEDVANDVVDSLLPVSAIKTEFIPTGGSDKVFNDFVVGPGKTELFIEPGETRTIEILVTNRMGDDRIFNLETEDTAGTNNPDVPIRLLGDERGPYTLKDYISYPQKSFILENNQRARIPVTVSIPIDAEAGGLYGSVLVTTTSKEEETDNAGGALPSSAVISRVGTLFFVTVPGDIDIAGSLKSFDTSPSQDFFAEGPINFQILFENTGSLHLNPYGELKIKNMMGEEVGFVELDPWFALPQSLRSREIEWNRELLIGKYTAVININRGYDDVVDTMSVTFWVLPWKLILVIFGSLFLFLFLIRVFFKTFEFKRKV